MEQFHATTILCVRKGDEVAIGGDGQVTLGNVVIKGSARKIRKLYHDKVLSGSQELLQMHLHCRSVLKLN